MATDLPKSEMLAFSPTQYPSEDLHDFNMGTKKEYNDSMPNLSLVKFSRAPFVSFGNVKLTSSKSSYLRIDNPTDEFPIVVKVDKVPSAKGFSVDQTKLTIEPGGSAILSITWTPVEDGGVREIITFIANETVKHQAVLLGKAEAPKKKKKSLWDSIKTKKTDSSVPYRSKKAESGSQKVVNKTFHVPKQPQYKRDRLTSPLSQSNRGKNYSRPQVAFQSEQLSQQKPSPPLELKSQVKSAQDDIENMPPTINKPQALEAWPDTRVLNKTLSPIAGVLKSNDLSCQSPLPVIKVHPAVEALDQSPLCGSPGLSLKEALKIIDSDISQPVSPPNACSSFDFSDSLESEKGGNGGDLLGRRSGECIAPIQLDAAEPRLTFFVKPKSVPEPACVKPLSQADSSHPPRPPVCSATVTKSKPVSPSVARQHERRIRTSRRKLLGELPSSARLEQTSGSPAKGLPVISTDSRQSSPGISTDCEHLTRDSSASVSSSRCSSALSSHSSHLVSVLTPPSLSTAEEFVVQKPSLPHMGKKRKSEEYHEPGIEEIKRTVQVKKAKPLTILSESNGRTAGKVHAALSTTFQKQPKPPVPSAKSCISKKTPRALSKPPSRSNQKASSLKSSCGSTVKKSRVVAVAQSQLVFIKPTQSVIPRHPLPFAAKNMFFDERWLEKQERGFTWWINYVLTPDDFRVTTEVTKVNALSLTTGDDKFAVPKAPTKEEMSLRTYTARRRLNRLRRSACQLFTSEEMVKAIQRLEIEVEAKRLLIRRDRHLWKDIGERQKVLNWLLSYNPLWLRIGLETIYGELISLETNNDVMGLAMFILGRLLWNPDLAAQYRHPKVPHLYKDGHEEALSRFTLKKLLLLVCFLDKAKESRLIEHDPCLFCMDAEFKTSKDLLLAFARDFLSGEGILYKHLGYLGLAVSHAQTPLDEFDFAVRNLATDLRSGIRLVRVMELFIQDWSLSKKLRMPAISRLQKIHNVELAFQVLKERGVQLKDERGAVIDPRDIVDGHREKTLSLLWKIIFSFQVEVLLDEEQLKEEISFLRRTWRTKMRLNHLRTDKTAPLKTMRSQPEIKHSSVKVTLLMDWVNAVCEFYGLQAENFTVSFSDGRILCCLMHHYHPGQLPLEDISQETTQTIECGHRGRVELNCSSSDSDSSFDGVLMTPKGNGSSPADFKRLLENERNNFLLVNAAVAYLGGVPAMINPSDMSNTIPNEKVVTCFLSFLCTRLLDLRNETRAARVIQGAWRKFKLKKDLELYQLKSRAASKIQAVVRRFLSRRWAEKSTAAVLTIQTYWRGYVARQAVERMKQTRLLAKQHHAASIIQRVYRNWRMQRFQRKTQAATLIQAWYRMHVCRREYIKLRSASIRIQAWFRGLTQRRSYLNLKLQRSSAIVIQSAYRGYLIRRQIIQKREAAILVQRWFRACQQRALEREQYLKMKRAAVSLQAAFRGLHTRQHLKRKQKAALIIQTAFRRTLAQKAFRSLRNAVLTMQCRYRANMQGKQVRKSYLEIRQAAVTLQSIWRGRVTRRRIAELHRCATRIQGAFRRHSAQSRFRAQRSAAIVIQSQYRAFRAATQARREYLQLREAAVVVQAAFRGMQVRRDLRKKHQSATVIQAHVRAFACRQRYLALKVATSVIQTHYRAHLLRRAEQRRYQLIRRATVTLQAALRGLRVRRHLKEKQKAAVIIQACFRSHRLRVSFLAAKCAATIIQQHYRAVLARRKAREEFLKVRAATITLQSAFRGMQARREVKRMHRAAKIIQAHVRGRNQLIKYQRSCWAARVIQQRYRAHLLRTNALLEYTTLRSATLCIQAHYRGFVVRKQVSQMHHAATVIQSMYRAYKQRMKYLVLKATVVQVQRLFRARQLMQQEQKSFRVKRSAAITIQSSFRGMKVRKDQRKQHHAATVIQACYRMYQKRMQFQAMRLATIIIQRQFRHHLQGQRAREDFLKLRQSVVKLQAIFRGRQTRCHIQKMHTAATIIQARFRMHYCRARYLKLQWATRIVQDKFRANRLRNLCTEQYMAKKMAALRIQSVFRGYQAREAIRKKQKMAALIQRKYLCFRERKRYLALRKAVVTCQRLYRARQIAMQCRQEYLTKQRACLTIQAFYRGMRVRRRLQQDHKAAVIIQAQVRKHLCRSRYVALLKAVQVIQDRYRATLKMKEAVEDYHRKRHAACLLQAAYRAMKARQRVSKMHSAAVVLQRFYRGWRHRVRFQALRASTVMIQRWLRATKAARKERQQYLALRCATLTLQSAFRGRQARMEIKRQQQAAMVIQAGFRKHRQYVKYQAMRISAIIIQRRFRAHLVGRDARRQFVMMRESAVTIQAAFRGHYIRQMIVGMHQAATVIQAHFRGWRQRMSFRNRRHAALVLQQRFRALQLRNEHVQRYQQMKTAAVCLQAAFRGKKSRQHTRRIKAARTIQSVLQMNLKRRRYLKMKMASIKIQSAFRAYTAQRQYTEMRTAATTIQKWYRSHSLVRHEQANLKTIRLATLTLQSAFRGMQARRKARQERAAVKIQAFVRMFMQRRRYLRMRQCALSLQAAIRMHLAGRSFRKYRTAAVVLQRRYRAHKAQREQRQQYLRTLCRLTLIQANVRGALQRKRFLKLKRSATAIQAAFRGRLVRQELERQKAAASVIQAHYQAYVHSQKERARFLKMKSSALLIQRAFRQIQARKRAQQMQAAVVIQACFRGRLARRDFIARQAAVATVHRCIQARRQRRRYLALQQSTSVIQQRWREKQAAKQQRRIYLQIKASAVSIQALWRGHTTRRQILKEHKAATLIQATFRVYVQRRDLKRLQEAVTKVQRHFRVVRQRRLEKEKEKVQTTAVTMLQAYCRGWLVRKRMKEAANARRRLRFSAAAFHHLSAVRIQRAFRAHQALKAAKKQMHSVLYIQRWTRAWQQRKRYLAQRQQVLVAQRAVRAWLSRRHQAASVIQTAVRDFLQRRRQEKVQHGIVKLQALWRGHCSRKQHDTRKIIALRRRLRIINREVKEEDRLCNKTSVAISYLMGCHNYGYIILALRYLETATRLSPECCEHLVRSGATENIVTLIRSCNRSVPSMDIISLSVQVLLNLSKYNRTIDAVFAVEHAVEMLLDLLQIYREKAGDKMADKGGSIFTKACFLLILLVQDGRRAAEVRSMPKVMERIRSIYHLTMRKYRKDTERMVTKQKMTGSLNGSLLVQATPRKSKLLPRYVPEWVLKKDKLTDIVDPLCAIKMLSTVLCVQP